jgi:transposase, IS5 family
MAEQLGFAEVFLSDKAGQNRRLSRIEVLIDWTAFVAYLPPAPPPGPGRPSYPALSMFKATLLAQWYQLSDPALEEALADRISFRRFCGFALDVTTPDETTFCRFRTALAENRLGEQLMAELDRQLGDRGFLVKEGTMIDATLIEAQAARPHDGLGPRGAHSRKTANEKDCNSPSQHTVVLAADRDARFAKKGGKTVFGYKAHVGVDLGSGLIRRALMTPANIHDTTPADDLVMGDESAVYADKAYATHARREALKARGIKDRIMHRPNRHHPELPFWQARRNALIVPIRATIERTFGTWKRSYGYTRVRYFSLAANALELQLKCFAFNLRRAAVLAAA